MCNFAFWRQIFVDFHLHRRKKFLTKGGSRNKISFAKEGSIECPARGGIRTLPFRREVTVPFPPPMPTCVSCTSPVVFPTRSIDRKWKQAKVF